MPGQDWGQIRVIWVFAGPSLIKHGSYFFSDPTSGPDWHGRLETTECSHGRPRTRTTGKRLRGGCAKDVFYRSSMPCVSLGPRMPIGGKTVHRGYCSCSPNMTAPNGHFGSLGGNLQTWPSSQDAILQAWPMLLPPAVSRHHEHRPSSPRVISRSLTPSHSNIAPSPPDLATIPAEKTISERAEDARSTCSRQGPRDPG